MKKMKSVVSVLLMLCLSVSLAFAGGSKETKDAGTLVVYGSCEEEYLAAACAAFEAKTGVKTTYQRLSTGEVLTKIAEENGNPSADVWFGGTTDPSSKELKMYTIISFIHTIKEMMR